MFAWGTLPGFQFSHARARRDLQAACIQRDIPKYGNKDELKGRILKHWDSTGKAGASVRKGHAMPHIWLDHSPEVAFCFGIGTWRNGFRQEEICANDSVVLCCLQVDLWYMIWISSRNVQAVSSPEEKQSGHSKALFFAVH